MKAVSQVLSGRSPWAAVCAPWETFVPSLPDDSIDLAVFSPPYMKARTYGIAFAKDAEEWAAWMVDCVRALSPKVKGVIAVNCEGQTENYRYHPAPQLLMADLHRAGFNLRRPLIFHRVGIPGSGGPDWLRGDTEPVICITRPGRLPWSDNTACGHPPKWAPGGDMSHRLGDGTRVNQWGGTANGTTPANRRRDGERQKAGRPSHTVMTRRKKATRGKKDGDARSEDAYEPPVLANPGNVVQAKYTADEIASLLAESGDVLHATVGGGCMGHPAAHDNEAPFPLELPAFLIRSFCPPDGLVLDCFCGSGTTIDAARQCGRRAIGCDVRQSQVDLTRRRMQTVTPALPGVV